MSCLNCLSVKPIQDTGKIVIKSTRDSTGKRLEYLSVCLNLFRQEGIFIFWYTRKRELLNVLNLLEASLSPEDKAHVLVSWDGPEEEDCTETTTSILLEQYIQRIRRSDIVEIIEQKKFTNHLQPIALMSNRRVIGYEFLLRASPDGNPFSPGPLFEQARETGLHSFLDRSARISAIKTSGRLLPKGIKRFINFLPSSIYNPKYCLSHTLAAIEEYQLDPADFVFEMVENEKIDDSGHLLSIFEVLKNSGIQVALDDVGAGFATPDLIRDLKPDYVKMDRSLISYCDIHTDKRERIKEIIGLAQSCGATVLAEGIERWEEWQCCKELGVSLAQGYLLGKPAPEPLSVPFIDKENV
ncbi:EAL domain-containing protein [Paenibacillus larvae]|uniref:Sensor-like protein n=4 Tax=Paenibacillus larvae TaxID=1464 RepID=V9WAH6_9BACL|nr:EAL domain-containing protein [Paenibacillus larvae]AHD06864.1 sensor-like protein [Paenibacillus larvae subsp. larvae DSM 25430]AQR76300.1 hypothetical protein BXP28_01670 [Paenibacillus larvae subsp. larvae]AQT84370.1 hypothetical protein B1222_08170 [Paenibacillus larvae subsp. pulvifaciens]AQZ46359.1 hypothetical protein B5S25_06745 [Paenibacillus larvae subsp. pulvifaciens]ARF67687.1 hypothetical protein B7C51_07410 [Paenibacillus larvae subsp. pulvifaciens]